MFELGSRGVVEAAGRIVHRPGQHAREGEGDLVVWVDFIAYLAVLETQDSLGPTTAMCWKRSRLAGWILRSGARRQNMSEEFPSPSTFW